MISRFLLKSFPVLLTLCAATSFAAVSPNTATLDAPSTSATEAAPAGHGGGGGGGGGGHAGGGGGGGGAVHSGGGNSGGGGHVGGGGGNPGGGAVHGGGGNPGGNGGHPNPGNGNGGVNGGHPNPGNGNGGVNGGHPNPGNGNGGVNGGHPNPGNGNGGVNGGHPNPGNGNGGVNGGHPNPGNGNGGVNGGHPNPGNGNGGVNGGHPNPGNGNGGVNGGHPNPGNGNGGVNGGHPNPGNGNGGVNGGHPNPGNGGHPGPITGPGGHPGGNNGGVHGGGSGGGFVNHNGNTVPAGHVGDINHAVGRMNSMRGNPEMGRAVDRENGFANQYRPIFENRGGIFDRFRGVGFPFYRNVWGPQYHFWGFGWRSPFVVGYNDYFWNPCFFWFYADNAAWDDGYFRTWYGPEYDRLPGFQNRFRRPWAFYPTQTFIDLTMGVSEWENQKQLAFRESMSDLTTILENNLTQELGAPVVLDQASIEVDHYQLLDNSVVLDGEVQVNGTAYAYKALVDLNNPTESNVVIPTVTNEQPTQAQIQQITTLNQQIVQQGGTLEDATEQNQQPQAQPATAAPLLP
jgi:hypothetical protein